jgi:tetratricopeptide (TPR) repeat protein
MGTERKQTAATSTTTRRAPLPTLPESRPVLPGLSQGREPQLAKSARGTGSGEGVALAFVGQQQVNTAIQLGTKSAFSNQSTVLVALQGERGSGKTRALVRASEIAAKQYGDVCVLYALCRSTEDGPYAPFSRLLLDRFGITPSSSPSAVRGQMATATGEVLKRTDAPIVSETTHLLGHIAGVPFPDSPFLRTLARQPSELHKRASRAVTRFFEGEAENRPLLILLDDMDKAEREAWELLDELLDTKSPIEVIVAGAEPLLERVGELSRQRSVLAVELKPLEKNDVTAMIKSLVPDLVSVPESLAVALTHRSRGNPETLRELLLALFEGGLFVRTPAGLEVHLPRLEEGALAVTMDDIIRARRDSLERYEREVVERAAVVGEVFREGALLALQRAESAPPDSGDDPLEIWSDDQDETVLAYSLSLLEERGFVVRIEHSDIPGFSEYTFQHAGTRRVIYNDLPAEVRVKRHAVIARWLGVNRRLRPEGVAAVLAPHLEHAGAAAQAGRVYLEAAAEERSRLRTTMALRYVDKAVSLIDEEDVTHRLDALHERGSLLALLGRHDESESAFRDMLRLAWTLGARGKAGAALNRIARIYRDRGEKTRTLDYLEAALKLFREAQDMIGVASTFDDLAQVHRSEGNVEPALAAAKQALEIRIRENDKRGQALSLNTIGDIMLDRGDFGAARKRLKEALELRDAIGDHEGALRTRMALGRLAYYQRKLDDAVTIYRMSLDRAREMSDSRLQSALLNRLGEALLANGKHEEAEAALREAEELAKKVQDQQMLAEIECNLGLLALDADRKKAEELIDYALSLGRACGSMEASAMAHRALARLRSRTVFDDGGRANGDAEKSFREAIRLFGECGKRLERALTLAEYGYHLIEKGNRKDAREVLSRAHEALRDLQLPEIRKVSETLAAL